MKIEEAKKAYSAYLDTLREQKRVLTKLLDDNKNTCNQDFDRIEITRELSEIDTEYQRTEGIMDHILTTEFIIHSSAVAKQQSEAAAEGAKEIGRIMTIYRRIASGGIVPSRDEQRLMEFSHELYMAAKTAAMLKQGEREEYDSLWDDDDRPKGDTKSPDEIAGDTEIAVPAPPCEK